MAKKFDAKAKAKRQKIIAAIGGVILIAVLAYQVPSLMKMMNKKPPVSAAPVTPAPVPGAVPGTPVSTPVLPGGTLSDSDPAAQAASGQLLSFDRFSSKDPFVQQANAVEAPAAPATPKTAPPPPPPPPPAASGPSGQSSGKRTSAQISVNGETEPVSAGATFPAADPVFQLVSVTRTTAKIGISGGSLSTGTTVTLTKGKKLTLMNTADGTRYELRLVSTS